jgi:positive regulator of sigma E activity
MMGAGMLKEKDHKHLGKIAVLLHIGNERVNVGWNVYLSPYISMLYYLSLMEIVVAKLFPDLFLSATSLAVVSYLAFIWLSYHLGKRHERIEALRKKLHARASK